MDDDNNHDEKSMALDNDEDVASFASNVDDDYDDDDDDDAVVCIDDDESSRVVIGHSTYGWTFPSLKKLVIGPNDYLPPHSDWKAVGRNNSIQVLTFSCMGEEIMSANQFADLSWGLARSHSSIQVLRIQDCGLFSGHVISTQVPFFLMNLRALVEFDLDDCHSHCRRKKDVCVGIFIDGLIHHTCLKKITLWEVHLSVDDCAKLAFLLMNPGSSLTVLHLYGNDIGDMGAFKLAEGFCNNSSLKELMLQFLTIEEVGWHAIFSSLQHTNCKLEMLHLRVPSIKEATVFSLSCVLQRHKSTLKTLHLLKCCLDDELGDIGINFPPLIDNNSVLDELRLSWDILTNVVVDALTRALAKNNRLRVLDLSINYNVTAEAWETLSTVLSNPNSSLEVLNLEENCDVDKAMHSFADNLSGNKMLKELRVTGIPYNDVRAYDALIHTLCNTSSILRTFNSNHTLERIFDKGNLDKLLYSNDLVCLLRLNRENSKSQAARLKIIKTHFSGSKVNDQPFNIDRMKLYVRPHAIAWMAKDEHLYQFLRAMPWLLSKVEDDADIKTKKQSRIERRS